MPHPLVDNPSGFPIVTVPDPLDPGNAASVEVPFQALADRTANLSRRVGGANTANGVARLQLAPDAPGLRALPHSDGDVARIRGIGLYEFRSEISSADDGLCSIRPLDIVESGAGRWILISRFQTLSIDSYENEFVGVPLLSSSSRTYVDTPQSVSLSRSLAKGDIVEAHGRYECFLSGSNSFGDFIVSITEGAAAPQDIKCTYYKIDTAGSSISSDRRLVPFSFRRTVASSGICVLTVRMQVGSNSEPNSQVILLGGGSIVAHAYRP